MFVISPCKAEPTNFLSRVLARKIELASKVSVCSALENTGITEIWEVIKEYNSKMDASDWKTGRRERQNIYFLHHTIKEELGNKKYNSLKSEGKLDVLETKLSEGKTIFQIIEKI